MSKYRLIAESIVTFREGYNVEKSLLGRHFDITLNHNHKARIYLPYGMNDEWEMKAPNEYRGTECIHWGYFTEGSSDTYSKFQVESILVHYYADPSYFNQEYDFDNDPRYLLKKIIDKLMLRIKIVNPNIVFISKNHQIEKNQFHEIKTSKIISTGDLINWSVGQSYLGHSFKYDWLKESEIMSAWDNIDKEISVPYRLFEDARSHFHYFDPRNCILSLATMVESVLRMKFDSYCSENNVPEALTLYVKKNTYGTNSYKKLLNALQIEITMLDDVAKKVMVIRDRVIHANYEATGKEAADAYLAAESFLKANNIPIFVDYK